MMEENINALIQSSTSLIENIGKEAKNVNSLVTTLAGKIASSALSTQKGLSFLEMKNHVLLQYLISLSGLILKKTKGSSIQNSIQLEHLMESRIVLEKLRPIEQKLKYQIDKLVRVGLEGKIEADPLRHKPNPGNLIAHNEMEQDSSDDDNEEKETKPKVGVYRPPKVAPQYYDDRNEEEGSRAVSERKKSFVNRDLVRELEEEFLDTPIEVHNLGSGHEKKNSKDSKDRQRYEETTFTRLPVTKREAAESRKAATIGIIGDELTDFSSKNRKLTPSKGKGKGSKKKRKLNNKRIKRRQ